MRLCIYLFFFFFCINYSFSQINYNSQDNFIIHIFNSGDNLDYLSNYYNVQKEKTIVKHQKTFFGQYAAEKQEAMEVSFSPTNTRIPEYTYNWPYDFFSLVELAQLETEITIKGK